MNVALRMGKWLTKVGTKKQRGVSVGWLANEDAYEVLCSSGYTRLADNPDVQICVNRIADLVSSMTIYLMQNTENGDKRIKNGLSRKIDIEPYSLMTRKAWMALVVRNLLLYGDGNAVVLPHVNGTYFSELEPLKPPYSLQETETGYYLQYNGAQYDHRDVLHFVINPDPGRPYEGTGYRVALKDIVKNLKQAQDTKNAFMTDKWRPSVIIAVDGLTEEFEDDEGREKILKRYISETGDGSKPWVIPADLIKVDQVKPLSLADLALNDAVELDKKTVAGIFGVPPFELGIGEFSQKQWNKFISTVVMPIAVGIQQEMTKKLLYASDLYFRFEPRSLYNYDITELSNVGANLYTRGILTGNEVRDSIGYSPREGLDELVILENYIPQGMIGDQKKLTGGDESEAERGANQKHRQKIQNTRRKRPTGH